MLVQNPGISVGGIDPGGSTGLVVYDAWDKLWYFAQLDAGMGRMIKHSLWPGVVESPEFNYWARKLGLVTAQGNPRLKAKNDPRIINAVEFGCTQWIIDIMMAVGPSCIWAIEDFVLGWGDPDRAGSSGREGIAPVRMIARIMQMMEYEGISNGDAWRNWHGFGSASKDKRGVVVRRDGGIGTLPERLARVRQWRDDGENYGDKGVLWRGGGITWTLSMPSQKLQVPDSLIKKQVVAIEGVVQVAKKNGGCFPDGTTGPDGHYQHQNLWWPGHPHAMDALRHAALVCKKLGVGLRAEWKPLFPGANKRVKEGS